MKNKFLLKNLKLIIKKFITRIVINGIKERSETI